MNICQFHTALIISTLIAYRYSGEVSSGMLQGKNNHTKMNGGLGPASWCHGLSYHQLWNSSWSPMLPPSDQEPYKIGNVGDHDRISGSWLSPVLALDAFEEKIRDKNIFFLCLFL